jgi:hypothetical protein
MSDWEPVFNVDTPFDRLRELADEYAQGGIDDMRAQLEADADLSPALREAILARFAPLFRARTREAFEAGWQRLQLQRVSSNDTVN